jgi:hypothetical protein
VWARRPTLIIYYAPNAKAPVVASAAPPISEAIVHTPSSKHIKAILLPVVKRLVAALAGVKTKDVSPAAEVSKVTSAAALDSIKEPVAQTSVPAALKVKVLVPPAVSLA